MSATANKSEEAPHNKWLVAVDGSKSSHKALHAAVGMLNKERDELFIVKVAPAQNMYPVFPVSRRGALLQLL